MIGLWRQHVDELVTEHRLVVTWVTAYARQRGNQLFIRRIVDAETYCEFLHEYGHWVSGGCTGRDPHFREPDIRTSLACLECETLATEWAARHARPAYSREMHAHLADALKSYRHVARGWPAATQRLDRLASNIGYCAEKQHRLTRRLDVAKARHEWNLLTAQQRLDHQIAEQKRRRQQMGRITR